MEDAAAAFAEFVDKRKARYTAQVLEVSEKQLETKLKRLGLLEDGSEISEAMGMVKAMIRAKFRELATDAIDAMPLLNTRVNGAAADLTAQLRPADADQGAPTT